MKNSLLMHFRAVEVLREGKQYLKFLPVPVSGQAKQKIKTDGEWVTFAI